MKIAVIGGAGVRTPLLVKGLTRADLPIDDIALFDVDRDRLASVSAVARAYAPCVHASPTASACVAGADFVFLSMRAGGIEARARDEAAAIALGVVGQETVGPAGFAMAMRNVPPAMHYASLVADLAPHAWVVNFANPVGIVTQAIAAAGQARAIGICDTPTELFEQVAQALGAPPDRCAFDYFGLNHLGWLREVYVEGAPQLHRVWNDPSLLARVYRTPLFDAGFLRKLRLLPTEYLFYYYHPRQALENLRAAGRTRGGDIAAFNERLFQELADAGSKAVRVYEAYLAERSGSYMRLESGAVTASDWSDASDPAALGGYDRIALDVVRAIHHNTGSVIPLNVPNAGTLPDLEQDDIVEVPCVVSANGARPLAVAPVPESVRDLLVHVKEYERFTVAAAIAPSMDAAVRALAHNPLVGTHALARRLVDAMRPLW